MGHDTKDVELTPGENARAVGRKQRGYGSMETTSRRRGSRRIHERERVGRRTAKPSRSMHGRGSMRHNDSDCVSVAFTRGQHLSGIANRSMKRLWDCRGLGCLQRKMGLHRPECSGRWCRPRWRPDQYSEALQSDLASPVGWESHTECRVQGTAAVTGMPMQGSRLYRGRCRFPELHELAPRVWQWHLAKAIRLEAAGNGNRVLQRTQVINVPPRDVVLGGRPPDIAEPVSGDRGQDSIFAGGTSSELG